MIQMSSDAAVRVRSYHYTRLLSLYPLQDFVQRKFGCELGPDLLVAGERAMRGQEHS